MARYLLDILDMAVVDASPVLPPSAADATPSVTQSPQHPIALSETATFLLPVDCRADASASARPPELMRAAAKRVSALMVAQDRAHARP